MSLAFTTNWRCTGDSLASPCNGTSLKRSLTSAYAIAAFVPLKSTLSSYAGLLAGAVCIQELVRYGVWRMHR